ncbi:MAG: hypothetical protein MI862_17870 [Desulfobacterales bacterium]|nr:hypothetical protein [Desulfobacterales bacterium]
MKFALVTLIHRQGPACCVACGGSPLRRMADTPSVVTLCRLIDEPFFCAFLDREILRIYKRRV